MKTLTIILFLTICISCNKEGEILHESTKTIKINGNEYRFIQVVPVDGERGVWILVPNDATVEMPKITAQIKTCGKNCRYMQTLVTVK